MSSFPIGLSVNGIAHNIQARPNETLLDVLRDRLGLTGTREGCRMGDCGSCTVLLDGQAVNSCLVLAPDADGHEITTVEGLAESGKLNALQTSFVRYGALQCGYCTSGMLLSATAFVNEHSGEKVSAAQVQAALAGNLCRCTGYVKIVQAILAAVNG